MQKTVSRTFRSSLGKVKGLGSARSGVAHWWVQRMTAVALIPLVIWFIGWMLPLWVHGELDPRDLLDAFQRIEIALPTLLWNACIFYHGTLGLQVIIEDYVPSEKGKVLGILAIRGCSLLGVLAGNLAVLKLFLD